MIIVKPSVMVDEDEYEYEYMTDSWDDGEGGGEEIEIDTSFVLADKTRKMDNEKPSSDSAEKKKLLNQKKSEEIVGEISGEMRTSTEQVLKVEKVSKTGEANKENEANTPKEAPKREDEKTNAQTTIKKQEEKPSSKKAPPPKPPQKPAGAAANKSEKKQIADKTKNEGTVGKESEKKTLATPSPTPAKQSTTKDPQSQTKQKSQTETKKPLETKTAPEVPKKTSAAKRVASASPEKKQKIVQSKTTTAETATTTIQQKQTSKQQQKQQTTATTETPAKKTTICVEEEKTQMTASSSFYSESKRVPAASAATKTPAVPTKQRNSESTVEKVNQKQGSTEKTPKTSQPKPTAAKTTAQNPAPNSRLRPSRRKEAAAANDAPTTTPSQNRTMSVDAGKPKKTTMINAPLVEKRPKSAASSAAAKAPKKPAAAASAASTSPTAAAISGRSLGRLLPSAQQNKLSAERARSVSPVKSVKDLQSKFGNPQAPPLIINNVPRGNILAKFGISQQPKNIPVPPPPPKKEFKWKLPEVSAAAKSTYVKPVKPTVYVSSAPEFRHDPNPPVIQTILDPEKPPNIPAKKETKKDEEIAKKEQKMGVAKDKKPVTPKVAAQKPKAGEKSKVVEKPKQKTTAEKPKPKGAAAAPAKAAEKPKAKAAAKPKAKVPPSETKPKPKEAEKKPANKEANEEAKPKDGKNEKEVAKTEEKKKEGEKRGANDNDEYEYYYEDDEEVKADEKETEVEEEPEEDEIPEEIMKDEEMDEEEVVVDEEMAVDDEKEDEEKENKRAKKGGGKRGGKKAKKEKKQPKEKRKWVPPPRPPPELIEMPPEVKKLFQILREENIRPTGIPFELPWESAPSLQNQAGMGAFGTHRDANIHIEEGAKKLVQGSLKSASLLTLFEENLKNFASQKGLGPFGARRKNIGNIIDSHEYDSEDKIKLSASIIPKLMKGLLHSQSEITPIGALRPQVGKVEYQQGQTHGCEPESNQFVSRQFKSNQPLVAGSCMMDRRRNVINLVEGIGEMKMAQLSQGIIPRIYSTDEIARRSGADFGAFRPMLQEVEGGGARMDYDQEMRCKLIIPFQTAASLH